MIEQPMKEYKEDAVIQILNQDEPFSEGFNKKLIALIEA